jgi:hypothetical protein
LPGSEGYIFSGVADGEGFSFFIINYKQGTHPGLTGISHVSYKEMEQAISFYSTAIVKTAGVI